MATDGAGRSSAEAGGQGYHRSALTFRTVPTSMREVNTVRLIGIDG
jgi:hypothetical protein